MEKITSITRMKETATAGILAYRYHIDGDTVWFNYDDICTFLNVSNRFIYDFYNNLLECNKTMFNDNNNQHGIYKITYFINKIALDQLEENQTMRRAILNIDINDLEKEEGLLIENDDNNYEFKQLVQNIKSELFTADRTKLNDCVYKLVNSRQINEIINTNEYDPALDEEVQNYREWLQEDYDPKRSLYVMYKENIHHEINNKDYVCYHKYIGPTLEEAVDILFNASIEE
jgi:hypothetical protein